MGRAAGCNHACPGDQSAPVAIPSRGPQARELFKPNFSSMNSPSHPRFLLTTPPTPMNNATPVPFGVLADAIAAIGHISNDTAQLVFNVDLGSPPELINYEVKVGRVTCMKISESQQGRVEFKFGTTKKVMTTITYDPNRIPSAPLTLLAGRDSFNLRTYFVWERMDQMYEPTFPHLRLLCLTRDLETRCRGLLLV